MEFKLFKLDIDELINKFAECESTSFAEFKKVWLSKKFSFIFEASPSVRKSCFMQTLYAHSIGYMNSTGSLSSRLGGLYCLYCLYETQPFKPPFKIYLSLGELRRLKNLVRDAKVVGAGAVSAILKRMLERSMFLFGSTCISEGLAIERVNENDSENAVMQKYQELFRDTTQLEHLIHTDLGAELEVDLLKNESSEYAAAKELAIKEASKVIDVENIKHIAENNRLIGDGVEKAAAEWNSQKELFHQQIGFGHHQNLDEQEADEDDDFGRELEESLLFEPVD